MKKFVKIALLIAAVLLAAALLAFTIRQAQANREIEAEWLEAPAAIPQLAATTRLEIIPLYEEASTGNKFISGHGVSYLIRTDSATILLDVGNNPEQLPVAPYAQNMKALGIEWAEVDRIVISHPHPDHVGGTKAWWGNTISFGDLPGGMGVRMVFVPAAMRYPDGVHATIPTLPAPDVATTGVISYPEVFPLSLLEPKGHEQALVIHVAGHGLVLITGCGHPGLEKLITRTENLYGLPVVAVVGGLHYGEASAAELEDEITFLQTRHPELVALSSHDSGPQAQEAFQKAFGSSYRLLRVGESIQFP